jgi:hypothetical protein
VNQFEVGAGLVRGLVWGLAALVASCGQVRHRDESQDTASDAGQRSNGAGASGSAGSGGAGSGGAGGGVGGLTLGDSFAGDDEAGSTGVGGTAHVAVPLLDTALCDNVFVRVEQLPDTAPFFSGTFDGEPVDVSERADVAGPPVFQALRFGPTHVEAISLLLYLPVGPYDAGLMVSAVDCGKYGNLFFRPRDGLHYYKLASAELHTVTNSVDGFSGLTRGNVFATWINDNGEQHVLKADFTLNAVMGDARAQP